jgi:hypothetical protein
MLAGILLGLFSQATATAQSAYGTEAAATPSRRELCEPGEWELRGADAARGIGATYRDDWAPTLARVASCLKLESMQRACVRVRGHFDEVRFDAGVVEAFGTPVAAQLARARARSAVVVSKLLELGASDERLIELPPAQEPSYRGVSLVLSPLCVADAAGPSDGKVQEVHVTTIDSGSVADEVARRLRPPAPPPPPKRIWLEAGAMMTAEWESAVRSPGLRLAPLPLMGAGVRLSPFYVRMGAGLSIGLPTEQRYGADVQIGAGYFGSDLLQVGIVGGYRIATWKLGKGWTHQAWFVGIEGTQCLVRLGPGSLCLREVVGPLGGDVTRAAERDGTLETIHEQSGALMRFDIGVLYRVFP